MKMFYEKMKVSIPYRYKQNFCISWCVLYVVPKFQSPIGTNKTCKGEELPLFVREFQSPIGTNKTKYLGCLKY